MRLHRMIAIAASLGLLQCSSGGGGEGSVGNPCVPADEVNVQFAGFNIAEETIITGVPDCGGGVCLVNHFQGRVSCPLGQPPPKLCSGPSDFSCGADEQCVVAGKLAPPCDPDGGDLGASACAGFGGVCDAQTNSCICNQTADCPAGSFCAGDDPSHLQCTTFVCHGGSSDCQIAGAFDLENEGRACCAEGTGAPVAVPVCGQCDDDSNRDAEKAVYCSCKCGPAEGAPPEDGSYCDCPAGFECALVRPYLGIGDPKLAGRYCIRQGSEFTSEQTCGQVKGFFNSQQCKGIGFPN